MDNALLLALLLTCCLAFVVQASAGLELRVRGESLIFTKTEPAKLCFDQIVPGTLKLRTTFSPRKKGSESYVEGKDFVVDYAAGTIARTPGSRLPDYSTNCLYGQKDFDHTKFAGFSNHAWFVWADYTTTNGKPWALPHDYSKVMAGVRKKLEAGGTFRIASYGDSITAGGEASELRYRFQARYGRYLEKQFPGVRVRVQDVSISGYSSQQGIDWFDKYMGIADSPDLALIGFGMNDHNIGGPSPEKFRENLVTIVKMIRGKKGAECILFSAFPPNDLWHYGSHRMGQFAEATKQAAEEAQCGYVDVWSTWEMVLQRKDQSSLLGNNINHPNDFGHWMYEEAFEAMRF
jgi:acyl-CoA thioesterase I